MNPFSDAVPEPGSLPVESYADRLMDDLFDEVERMLDGSVARTTDTAPSRSTPASEPESESLSLARLAVPAMTVSPADLAPPAMAFTADEAPLAPSNTDALADELLNSKGSEPKRTYDRLLLGVGCLSIVVTLGVWLLTQQANRKLIVASAPTQTAPATQTASSPADNQFVQYLQQALKTIDSETQSNPSASPALPGTIGTAPQSSPGLPVLPVSPQGSPTLAPPTVSPGTPVRPATGLSRLVPFYQMPQTPTPLNQPGAASPTTPRAAVRAPIPLSVPGIARTLTGVLELGDRSAALIEINGVTQRFRVGESIGSSGWTLVEVAKNQAVVRRNGEVRSVMIGQSF